MEKLIIYTVKISDYLIGESYDVCAHRLQLLLERQTLQVAFNLSEFLISNVCNPEKQISSLIIQRWLTDAKDVSILLDIHIGLMFRLKKGSFQINHSVTTIISYNVLKNVSGTSEHKFSHFQQPNMCTQKLVHVFCQSDLKCNVSHLEYCSHLQ